MGSTAQAQAPDRTLSAPGDAVISEEDAAGLLVGAGELAAEIHGFVNLEYSAFAGDPTAGPATFDIHNVFLSTKARVGSRTSVFIELEYEHGSEVKLDRAFIDFEVAEALTLRAGRFSVPLSYERMHYAAPVRLMTSRPYSVDLAFHEWVDTGLQAYGRLGWLGYNVSLLNGPRGLTEAGVPNLDVIDVNRNKTVVGRLVAQPSAAIEAGLAGAIGSYDPQDKLWFQLVEVDFRGRMGAFEVWAEGIFRNGADEPCDAASDSTCSPTYAGDRARKVGGYVLLAFTAMEQRRNIHYLKPMVRLDAVQDLTSNTGRQRVTAGLNWSPFPHCVLKSELQWSASTELAAPARWGAMASVVADF
jgi:hypothetical protein